MQDWRSDRVGAAVAGCNPTVLSRLPAGFAVIGDAQWLPGYCLLLTDDPRAGRLSDLPPDRRRDYLASVERLAEAVEQACKATDPSFRRVNIEILGNTEPYLHTHVWPRYDWEPEQLRGRPVWLYPASYWHDPATALSERHDALRTAITAVLRSGGSRGLRLPHLCRPPVELRPFAPEDVDAVLEAATDPLIPMISTVPARPDTDSAAAFVRRQQDRAATGEGYSFAIADTNTGTTVGQIGLWPLPYGRASIGYWIIPSARRHGYGTRALRLISEWGLKLPGLVRLELYVEPFNEASWRTAERVGFEREGLLRRWQPVGGQHRDMYMYARTDPSPQPSTRQG